MQLITTNRFINEFVLSLGINSTYHAPDNTICWLILFIWFIRLYIHCWNHFTVPSVWGDEGKTPIEPYNHESCLIQTMETHLNIYRLELCLGTHGLPLALFSDKRWVKLISLTFPFGLLQWSGGSMCIWSITNLAKKIGVTKVSTNKIMIGILYIRRLAAIFLRTKWIASYNNFKQFWWVFLSLLLVSYFILKITTISGILMSNTISSQP